MLKINDVVKTYKHAKTPALKGVSLSVDNGEVYGLIGKNGAGKSTLIKCVIGMHPFEKGTITINGHDIKQKENKAKKLIGYVPDNHSVYESLTGREYVNFMADIYGVDVVERERRIRKYEKLFNLKDAMDTQINGYSHGMHQKIAIMGALIHTPKLWILDEPFLGLDPQSVQAVKDCIVDYSKNKRHMVIFSSHDIETVIKMCDKVCVIENGNVKEIVDMSQKGSAEKLKKLMN